MTAPLAPRRQPTGPGRVVAIVASVFLLVIGAGLVLGGAALMVVFGTGGQISSAMHPVKSPTAAVVTDIAAIRDTAEVADVLGTPTAKFAADGGNASGLFVGIGPAAEVDSYLSGVEIDQVVDFELDPYVLDLARRDGTQGTVGAPTAQDFWVASDTATAGLDLSWQVQDGDYRMVLMNADGAPGVDSRLSVGVGLGGLYGLSLGMLIGGVVLIGIAVALLVLTRPRRLPPPFANGYVPSADYPPAPPAATTPPATVQPPADPVPPVPRS